MSKLVDEILEALPEVGLSMSYMGQHTCGTWGVYLCETTSRRSTFWGEGDSPAAALIEALKMAGIDATDDGT